MNRPVLSCAVMAVMLGAPMLADAQAPGVPFRSGLGPNESLMVGDYLQSPGRKYVLILQTDGNLVLYTKAGVVLWASQTVGKRAARCTMQNDGNLVLYDVFDQPLWGSHTNGQGGTHVTLQDDGNLVIYAQGPPKWSTHTSQP